MLSRSHNSGFAIATSRPINGFQPKLTRSLLGSSEFETIGFWGMSEIGRPFVARQETDAALWHGVMPNKAGELAVISVVCPHNEGIDSQDTEWYAGILAKADLVESETTTELADRVRLYTPARDASNAVHLVRRFLLT